MSSWIGTHCLFTHFEISHIPQTKRVHLAHLPVLKLAKEFAGFGEDGNLLHTPHHLPGTQTILKRSTSVFESVI